MTTSVDDPQLYAQDILREAWSLRQSTKQALYSLADDALLALEGDGAAPPLQELTAALRALCAGLYPSREMRP